MADRPTTPADTSLEAARWPKLLSLSAHELRSPLSVVAGYIRMLLKGTAGPLADQQRRLLEEAEKSCARLSTVLAEMSALAQLESGTAPFNRSAVNLRSILTEAITALPDVEDRAVPIAIMVDAGLTVHGDAVRLRTAFASILHALRRELVASDQLEVRVDGRDDDGRPSLRITIGEPLRMDGLLGLAPSRLATFDEWRGGNGLSLPNARRTIEAHGGHLWSPAEEGKGTAIVILPAA